MSKNIGCLLQIVLVLGLIAGGIGLAFAATNHSHPSDPDKCQPSGPFGAGC